MSPTSGREIVFYLPVWIWIIKLPQWNIFPFDILTTQFTGPGLWRPLIKSKWVYDDVPTCGLINWRFCCHPMRGHVWKCYPTNRWWFLFRSFNDANYFSDYTTFLDCRMLKVEHHILWAINNEIRHCRVSKIQWATFSYYIWMIHHMRGSLRWGCIIVSIYTLSAAMVHTSLNCALCADFRKLIMKISKILTRYGPHKVGYLRLIVLQNTSAYWLEFRRR